MAILAAPWPAEIKSSPTGLLETHTLFNVYGRGFGIAPILGHLGTYKDFAAMESDTKPRIAEVRKVNGGKPVVTGLELIYGLATPCRGNGDCLDYLEGTGDLVEKYVKPAAQRGWVVVLDTQLGRSDPAAQIRRMIDRGYLRYENVHVAIDPEFHVYPGHTIPGTPIGTVSAAQVNAAQKLLNDYVVSEHLATKKILIVHQFGDKAVHDGVPFMIQQKLSLQTYPNVELVIDMDGIGSPFLKVKKYNLITSSKIYPCVHFRGIKVFYRSPLETHGHYDKPPMTMPEVFGTIPVPGGIRMATKPDVVIIA